MDAFALARDADEAQIDTSEVIAKDQWPNWLTHVPNSQLQVLVHASLSRTHGLHSLLTEMAS
jgi:hypothetical protein